MQQSKDPVSSRNVITAITVQKRNTGRCSISIDGEFAFGCAMDIVLEHRLTRGMVLREEDILRFKEQDSSMYARQRALRFAVFKPRTEKQVREKLRRMDFHAEQIDDAVEFLYEFDYLNDKRFALMYINDYLLRKSVGKEKLRVELMKTGIDKDTIAEALTERFPEDENENMLRTVATKKLALLWRKKPADRIKALQTYLRGQGFSFSDIRSVVDEILEDQHVSEDE